MIKPSQIILALESDEKILSFKTQKGLPLWFLARYEVLLAVLNKNNNLNIASGPNKKKSIVKTALFSFLKSPLFIGNGKIIFFNSGVTNVRRRSDSKFFNRVTDSFFFRVQPQALLIEDTVSGELRMPRVHNKVYPHLSLILLSRVFGVFKKETAELKKSIEGLITYICKELQDKGLYFDRDDIARIVHNHVIGFLKKSNFYERFLTWKSPKVIFLEDASYGSRSFILINAKKLNIPVVELQHGFVNEEHFAYRLGPGIADHHFSKLFYPDYFLAYGKFWQESINIPSRVLCIGNPYLSSQIQKVEQHKAERRILFLSSAVAYEEAVDFLLKLKPKADKEAYEMAFRPHPVEMNAIESRYRLLIDAGITISNESQLYEDFSLSTIIIGELSTALFEALAIKGKRKFLFMSSYTKSYFNDKIKIPQVKGDTINDIFHGDYPEDTSNYFWEDNWQENFDDFISEL